MDIFQWTNDNGQLHQIVKLSIVICPLSVEICPLSVENYPFEAILTLPSTSHFIQVGNGSPDSLTIFTCPLSKD